MVLMAIRVIIFISILVSKYKDGYEWGGVFAMNPGEKTLSDEEYQDMVEKYCAVFFLLFTMIFSKLNR